MSCPWLLATRPTAGFGATSPSARALPPNHVARGGQNWTPIGGQIWKPFDSLDIAKSVFSNGTMSGISKRVAQGFLSPQLGYERLGASQLERIEPLGEPVIDRSHQRQCFALSPFAGPKPGKCRGRAQLPELRLLTARDLKRLNETVFSPGPIGSGPRQQRLGGQAQDLCDIEHLSVAPRELAAHRQTGSMRPRCRPRPF